MATQVIAAQAGFEYGRRDAAMGRGDRAVERVFERVFERNQALMAAQQRARRGPTPEVLFAKRFDNSRLVKAPDPVRVKEMLLGVFMFYGWQHFSGIEYGYHIESEKAQLKQLQEQNRQLRLQEAQLGDPARIDQLAHQFGLTVSVPGQVVRPDAPVDPNAPVLAETHPLLPALR